MTTFKVNFSDVEEFSPIPAGVYPVVVVDFTEEEGPAGPYIAYTFEIIGGEYDKRNLWTNLSTSPKALWKLKEALIAFGEKEETLEGDFEFNPELYVGVECRAVVIQDKYQGKTTNKIDSLLPLEGPKTFGSGKTTAKGSRPKIR